jgi:GTP-binding protein
MAFTDEIKIHLRAGKGGNGVVRWRREKFEEFGGPAGGNGGRGGDVYLKAVRDNLRLAKYVGIRELSASNGEDGRSKSQHGKNGDDLVIEVPRGTVATNLSTGQSYDLAEDGMIVKVLTGGQGGLGNEYFKASTNVAPQESTQGKNGEEADFHLELQMFADAGFIGLPNAGKSTLLNFLTGSKSKTAEYAFTTLDPHLGALDKFILADIPGLIEGASEGRGLGHKFLRHIRRTKLLIHCIALDRDEIRLKYKAIRNELSAFDPDLIKRPEIVVLTKSDTVSAESINKARQEFPEAYVVSVLSDESLKSFKEDLLRHLSK